LNATTLIKFNYSGQEINDLTREISSSYSAKLLLAVRLANPNPLSELSLKKTLRGLLF
jgi:hypothetical protein